MEREEAKMALESRVKRFVGKKIVNAKSEIGWNNSAVIFEFEDGESVRFDKHGFEWL